MRNRWRLQLALRGAVVVVAGTLLALLLSASSLEALRFSPAAIITFRIVALVVFAGARRATASCGRCGAASPTPGRAVSRRTRPDARGRDPERGRSRRRRPATRDRRTSPQLVEQLVEQAIEQCRALDNGLGDRARRRCSATLIDARPASPAAAALLIVVRPGVPAPAACRRCSSSRAARKRRARTSIEVTPGNAKVPRGADQTVKAKLLGLHVDGRDADDAHATRRRRSSACRSSPATDPAAFEGMLFHLEKPTEYYVESNGVESPTLHDGRASICRRSTSSCSSTTSPPTPGSQPRTVEPGGDVAAHARHARCGCTITPTMTTPGGQILLNETRVARR